MNTGEFGRAHIVPRVWQAEAEQPYFVSSHLGSTHSQIQELLIP